MDAKLAEIYGTNQVDESDVEKLAAAQLATKLAGEEEVDVAGLSDEDAEALAAEVLGTVAEQAEGEEEPAAEGAEGEEGEPAEKTAAEGELSKEAQEKIAEADYLGRVMAHAYVQERREIEKQAKADEDQKAEHKRLARGSGRIGAAAYGTMGAVGGAMKGAAKGKTPVGKVLKGVAGAAGGGAVGGGLGYGIGYGGNRMGNAMASAAGGKKKEKEVKASAEPENLSALDTLALARAQEILKANGIEPEQAPAEEPTEKTSSLNEEQLALLQQKVDERAFSMLQQAGYTFKDAEEGEKTEE